MAPKAKKSTPAAAETPSSKSKPTKEPKAPTNPPPKTIGEALQAAYLASRPSEALLSTTPWPSLTPAQKTSYSHSLLLSSGAYTTWPASQQKEFLRACEAAKIPFPLPEPRPLGTDPQTGRRLEDFGLEEYRRWEAERIELLGLREEASRFRRRAKKVREWRREREREERERRILGGADQAVDRKVRLGKGNGEEEEEWILESELRKLHIGGTEREASSITAQEIEAERKRRVRIAQIVGGKMPGLYEGDPAWDDVVPIPQDDGEKPLAAIAYTDEYAEVISYLRAIMASHEHSQRALDLTAHIISLNPAHYTVWLYRAQILGSLSNTSDITSTALTASTINTELTWLNDIALANQKNYQIWHHRQHLITALYPSIAASRTQVLDLARTEIAFMGNMFELDSKNYHVWSYRQFLVRKLEVFPSQCGFVSSNNDNDNDSNTSEAPNELQTTATLLEQDVRNNSAWAHRFFIVFSDPAHSTPDSGATERDERLPVAFIEREVAFARWGVEKAPMNMSAWNYLRGVLAKGGWGLSGPRVGGSTGEEEAEIVTDLEKWAAQFVYLPPLPPPAGTAEESSVESQSGGKAQTQPQKHRRELVKSTHALEYLADIWAERGEVERADRALALLAEKYDRVRRAFWEWRRESLRTNR